MWVRSLGAKVPWRRKCQPTPGFLPGESHGQSPEESDITERLKRTREGRTEGCPAPAGSSQRAPVSARPQERASHLGAPGPAPHKATLLGWKQTIPLRPEQ